MARSVPDVTYYVSIVSGINAGTTSTVALLRDSIELVVGSVGDSRAMLCRKGKALKLTVDHTPERKDEKERYQDFVSYSLFVSLDEVQQREIVVKKIMLFAFKSHLRPSCSALLSASVLVLHPS